MCFPFKACFLEKGVLKIELLCVLNSYCVCVCGVTFCLLSAVIPYFQCYSLFFSRQRCWSFCNVALVASVTVCLCTGEIFLDLDMLV